MIWMVATLINAHTMLPEAVVAGKDSTYSTVAECEADIPKTGIFDPTVIAHGGFTLTKPDGTKLYVKLSCEERPDTK